MNSPQHNPITPGSPSSRKENQQSTPATPSPSHQIHDVGSPVPIPSPLNITRPIKSLSSQRKFTRTLSQVPSLVKAASYDNFKMEQERSARSPSVGSFRRWAPGSSPSNHSCSEWQEEQKQKDRPHLHAATQSWTKMQQLCASGSLVLSVSSVLTLDAFVAIACHGVKPSLDLDGKTNKSLVHACDVLPSFTESNVLLYSGLPYIEEIVAPFCGPIHKRQPWESSGKEQIPGAMPKAWLRATMLCAVHLVLQGRCFVRPGTLESLVQMLRNDMTPLLPMSTEHHHSGGVEPMHYIVAMLQGSRKVTVQMGEKHNYRGPISAREGLELCGCELVDMNNFESYMLMNSAAFQLGVAAITVKQAEQMVYLSQLLTAFTLEVVERDAKWADECPDDTIVTREFCANIRGLIKGSTRIYGLKNKKEDNDLPEHRSPTELYKQDFAPYPRNLTAAIQDLQLVKQQIEDTLSYRSSDIKADIDTLACALASETRLQMRDNDTSGAGSASPAPSLGPTAGSHSSCTDDGLKGINKKALNRALAHRIIQAMSTHVRGDMSSITSASSKTRNAMCSILSHSQSVVSHITSSHTNSLCLPSLLAFNGPGSSPLIEACMNEIPALVRLIGTLDSSLGMHDGFATNRHAAQHIIDAGLTNAITARVLATQIYVVTHAADLRTMHANILLPAFERMLTNSLPLLGARIYGAISRELVVQMRTALFEAVGESWSETARHGSAATGSTQASLLTVHDNPLTLEARCVRAVDAALPVLIEWLTENDLADASGTFNRWRADVRERFLHWVAYWPKVLRPEPEKEMGGAGKLLYKLVREKLGVRMDKSGVVTKPDENGVGSSMGARRPAKRGSDSSSSGSGSPAKRGRSENQHGRSPSKSPGVPDSKDNLDDPRGKGKGKGEAPAGTRARAHQVCRIPNPQATPAPVSKILDAILAGQMNDLVMGVLTEDLSTPLAAGGPIHTRVSAKDQAMIRTEALRLVTGIGGSPQDGPLVVSGSNSSNGHKTRPRYPRGMILPLPPPAIPANYTYAADTELLIPSRPLSHHPNPFESHEFSPSYNSFGPFPSSSCFQARVLSSLPTPTTPSSPSSPNDGGMRNGEDTDDIDMSTPSGREGRTAWSGYEIESREDQHQVSGVTPTPVTSPTQDDDAMWSHETSSGDGGGGVGLRLLNSPMPHSRTLRRGLVLEAPSPIRQYSFRGMSRNPFTRDSHVTDETQPPATPVTSPTKEADAMDINGDGCSDRTSRLDSGNDEAFWDEARLQLPPRPSHPARDLMSGPSEQARVNEMESIEGSANEPATQTAGDTTIRRTELEEELEAELHTASPPTAAQMESMQGLEDD
ncbi:hypothetical protein BJ170DRAFT_719632 [Xylariales sp. AK1849]|nr:hypothetical protein BJ170DRAFT_719632 [Xylariales sp. AK1849]